MRIAARFGIVGDSYCCLQVSDSLISALGAFFIPYFSAIPVGLIISYPNTFIKVVEGQHPHYFQNAQIQVSQAFEAEIALSLGYIHGGEGSAGQLLDAKASGEIHLLPQEKKMNAIQLQNLTLAEFLTLPSGETAFELVDGRAIPKVSPKYFHSSLQKTLLRLIEDCCKGKGRILPEWAVVLQRNGKDWVPTPDLTYVSYDRLPKQWKRNEACPVPCTLAIEIISPGQTFGEFEEKASDYLNAGCDRVWVIEPDFPRLTAFFPNGERLVYEGDRVVEDELLPGLSLSVTRIWQEAEL